MNYLHYPFDWRVVEETVEPSTVGWVLFFMSILPLRAAGFGKSERAFERFQSSGYFFAVRVCSAANATRKADRYAPVAATVLDGKSKRRKNRQSHPDENLLSHPSYLSNIRWSIFPRVYVTLRGSHASHVSFEKYTKFKIFIIIRNPRRINWSLTNQNKKSFHFSIIICTRNASLPVLKSWFS